MHADSVHKIDPTLGWHLWATDLCLAVARGRRSGSARVLRVPIVHNSYADHTVPPAWHQSAATLKAKYPELDRIATLCGNVESGPPAVAMKSALWPPPSRKCHSPLVRSPPPHRRAIPRKIALVTDMALKYKLSSYDDYLSLELGASS